MFSNFLSQQLFRGQIRQDGSVGLHISRPIVQKAVVNLPGNSGYSLLAAFRTSSCISLSTKPSLKNNLLI